MFLYVFYLNFVYSIIIMLTYTFTYTYTIGYMEFGELKQKNVYITFIMSDKPTQQYIV